MLVDYIFGVLLVALILVYTYLMEVIHSKSEDCAVKRYLRYYLSYTGELDDFKDWLMSQGFVSTIDSSRYIDF